MKELPKVYVNPIEKNFINSQKLANSNELRIKKDYQNLSMKLKSIFSSTNYVYKRKVLIITKDSSLEKTIIGKSNGYLLTIDNEKIKISDIYDIQTL